MAFDPLSWAVGYILTQGLNKIVTKKSLPVKLQKRLGQWAKTLPTNSYICPEALFPDIESNPTPLQQPALYSLRQTLIAQHIPSESDWLNALIEQWHRIHDNHKDPQPFFQLQESTAKEYLAKLAIEFSNECKQDEQLFHTTVIDILTATKRDFNWFQVIERSNKYLTKQLDIHSYNLSQDVRQECVKNILSLILSDKKPILLLSGNSGQGKSWLMYSSALTLSSQGSVVILIDATGNTSKDLETVANTFWHDIKGSSSTINIRGVIAALREAGLWKKQWLTLFIDGVQDKTEIQELVILPWEEWGIKVVISCLPEVSETISENSTNRYEHLHINGFTITELHDYLRKHLQSNWYGIPRNVINTLCRPLLAKLYCDLAKGKSWQPNNEYELFDKYWSHIDKNTTLDSSKLKILAHSILHGGSYPWSKDQLLQAGLDNKAVETLVKSGWIQKTSKGLFEIWHDRLLNWAVAESLIAELQSNNLDQVAFCNQLNDLYKSEQAYSGKYLGYVPMDVIWMAVSRDILSSNLISKIIEVLENTSYYYKEILSSQLLPTIGPKIIPALFERLEAIIIKDDFFMLNKIIDAITSFKHNNVTILANRLLMSDQPLFQLAAMKIFSRRPDNSVLDRLWELHCKIEFNPKPYLRERENKSDIYHDSFGALKSCVKLHPNWLEQTIDHADSPQPVHDLAWLIANLDDGHNIWHRCKKTLFEKVSSTKERCLAINIGKYCDNSELDWLISRINKNADDLSRSSALHALIRINPDRAIEEMVRLPNFELYLSRQYCFFELLMRRSKATCSKIFDMMNNCPNLWDIAHIFQGNENFINNEILSYLLDSFESLLDKELSTPSTSDKHPLYRPLSLLSEIHKSCLLECFQNRRGSSLEEKLTSWLLKIGPRLLVGWDSERKCAMEILYKMGGSGFTKVVNSWLNTNNQYSRFDGLSLSMKRFDLETINNLAQITQEKELWNDFPFDQSQAAFVLAQLDQIDAVIKAILQWGLKLGSEVTHWKLDHLSVNDNSISSLFDNLKYDSEVSPGLIRAIGVVGRKDKVGVIRAILQKSSDNRDIIIACILTLGRLCDDSPETVELIAEHLEVKKYRHVAKTALFQIASNQALDKLFSHLEKQYDEWLAINLLEYEHTFDKALSEIQKYLENKNEMDKLRILNRLYGISPEHKALSILLSQTKYQNAVRTAIYIDENSSSWHIGLKASAIDIFAKIDKEAAFEAAWTTLQDRKAHDREYYPCIMININKQRAISFLLIQLGLEESHRVIRTIENSLNKVSSLISIDSLFKSSNTTEKLAAIRLAGRMNPSAELEKKLKDFLNEVDESISLAAKESLEQMNVSRETEILIKAISSEQNISHKWILLDSLLAIADPGDGHTSWPSWASELIKTLPAHMQYYFIKTMKKRREEFTKELDKKDRQLQYNK